jgi:hypothetical protein
MAKKEDEAESVVVAECVGCGHRKSIHPGEVPEGDQPMCPLCFMPMVAVEAKGRAGASSSSG